MVNGFVLKNLMLFINNLKRNNMNYKIIKLKDNFILVSDEPKINGDECIHLTTFNKSTHHDIDNNLTKWWKIISENPDFSDLKEEDCKEIGYVDVEKLAHKASDIPMQLNSALSKTLFMTIYKDGFKTAQSLNDKRFSRKQIVDAVSYGMQKGLNIGKVDETDSDWVNNYIQSLQQTVWNVKVEMEYQDMHGMWFTKPTILSELGRPLRPKITNNSIKIIKLK